MYAFLGLLGAQVAPHESVGWIAPRSATLGTEESGSGSKLGKISRLPMAGGRAGAVSVV